MPRACFVCKSRKAGFKFPSNESLRKRWCLLLDCEEPSSKSSYVCEDHFLCANQHITKSDNKRRRITGRLPIPITNLEYSPEQTIEIISEEGMLHQVNRTVLASASPFLEEILLSSCCYQKVVLHLPVSNTSVRYFLEALHTGQSSNISKVELINVRTVLQLLGTDSQMIIATDEIENVEVGTQIIATQDTESVEVGTQCSSHDCHIPMSVIVPNNPDLSNKDLDLENEMLDFEEHSEVITKISSLPYGSLISMSSEENDINHNQFEITKRRILLEETKNKKKKHIVVHM